MQELYDKLVIIESVVLLLECTEIFAVMSCSELLHHLDQKSITCDRSGHSVSVTLSTQVHEPRAY